ncbi:MAG: NTP transferase domain-containing protein [Coriobacteriia bacterium]|nr:NTP transferase domain-containing protein [Coriobacteriia bacterium]
MARRAVILAGGRGTRLLPYTTVFPKPLMPIGDTPILEVVLRQLAAHGFERATLAVGHLAELIEAFFGDGSKFGIGIDYCREDEPLGTAGSLAYVAGLTEPFLVMNGDVLTTLDYSAFLLAHASSSAAASIAVKAREQRIDFGIVEMDQEGDVVGYVEKPVQTHHVSIGVYAFLPSVLGFIERGEYLDFPDLVLRLIGSGQRVRSVAFDGYWLDIGRHDDLARAQEEFESMRERLLQGGP